MTQRFCSATAARGSPLSPGLPSSLEIRLSPPPPASSIPSFFPPSFIIFFPLLFAYPREKGSLQQAAASLLAPARCQLAREGFAKRKGLKTNIQATPRLAAKQMLHLSFPGQYLLQSKRAPKTKFMAGPSAQ